MCNHTNAAIVQDCVWRIFVLLLILLLKVFLYWDVIYYILDAIIYYVSFIYIFNIFIYCYQRDAA